MSSPNTLASVVRDARKQKSLTLQAVASQVIKEGGQPITPQYVYDIERGRCSSPSDGVLDQLAGALGLNRDWLYYLCGRLPKEIRERQLTAAQITRMMAWLRKGESSASANR